MGDDYDDDDLTDISAIYVLGKEVWTHGGVEYVTSLEYRPGVGAVELAKCSSAGRPKSMEVVHVV